MWMRIMGLRRAMQSMTERSQTVEGMCSTAGRCGSSHSDSVKISARSLYSPFLLAVPYKAGIVGT